MKFQADQRGDALLVEIDEKRLDAANSVALRDALVNLAAEHPDARIVIDLGKVELVDSSGLGALVSALKVIKRTQSAALCSLQKPVDNLMKLTRMDRMFTIHPDAETAVAPAGV